MNEGIVYNIQRYCIHDGPGIRTTVFLKGCPLECVWCHNPEGLSQKKEILFNPQRCAYCKMCIKICPHKAIATDKGKPQIKRTLCKTCGKCISICPSYALELKGRTMASEDIVKEITKDSVFYEQSGGGVTFSGGEPLYQGEFLAELLKLCKKKGLHTAVDTSGYSKWEVFESIIPFTDLFLYDLKFSGSQKHKKYTGVPNKSILENLKNLAKTKAEIIVRIPVIPGINDDSKNITETGNILSKLKIKNFDILTYHETASDKYTALGKNYKLKNTKKPNSQTIEKITEKIKLML